MSRRDRSPYGGVELTFTHLLHAHRHREECCHPPRRRRPGADEMESRSVRRIAETFVSTRGHRPTHEARVDM